MKNYSVVIVENDFKEEEFLFDDLQEALAKYDYEMKMDHNDLLSFGIVVRIKTIFGWWRNLISFKCEVDELNVLLKSS